MSVALALNLACSGAEPEKAIFVVPDTTVVDPPEELPASPSTTLEFDSGEITDVSAQANDIPPEASSDATTTTEPKRLWTLLAGGDVLLDRTEPKGIDPFKGVQPHLSSADIAIVNLEMAITERGEPYDKEFVFRAPGSAALTLAGAGIDVVSLANNHTLDFGLIGLEDTIGVLDEVEILRPGAGGNNAEAYAPRVMSLDNGIRVAFVSATAVVPGGFAASSTRAGVADARGAISRVLAAVRAAASGNDVVVVSVHWGVERRTCPNESQRDLARELIDAGANLILGHHPHVLQPIETFDRTVIAYSLGNFAWHPRYGITGETGALEVFFDGARVEGYLFHPHVLDDDGGPRPVREGDRYNRIIDITEGRCEEHDPGLDVTEDESDPASSPETG